MAADPVGPTATRAAPATGAGRPGSLDAMSTSTQSSIVIAAPPNQVLDVIADFADYPQWAPEMRSVEVLTEDGDGWADRVRFRIESGPIKDTYTLDYEWDVVEDGTGVVSWTLVEGEVLKAMDGSYTLESVAEGTKVTYALAVDVRIPMIGAIKRTAEKKIVTGALDGLKKRVEG